MDVDIEKCIVQLIDHSTLNWQDFEGRSPLHLATANGNLRYGLLSSTVVLYGPKKVQFEEKLGLTKDKINVIYNQLFLN